MGLNMCIARIKNVASTFFSGVVVVDIDNGCHGTPEKRFDIDVNSDFD